MVAIGLATMTAGCAHEASPAQPAVPAAPTASDPDAAATTGENLFIDGNPVDAKTFDALFATLGEERSNWYCDDMAWVDENGNSQGGGEEGWEATDPDGRLYRVIFRFAGDDSRSEITRIDRRR